MNLTWLLRQDNPQALLDATPTAPSDPRLRFWHHLYRGLAQDRLGRRAAAVLEHRQVLALHPYGYSQQGLEAPLMTMKHLER